MESIMEQLFYGELRPCEKIIPDDPQYRPLTHQVAAERDYLKTKVAAADQARLEELGEMYLRFCNMDCFAGFTYGFRLGVRMMSEIG